MPRPVTMYRKVFFKRRKRYRHWVASRTSGKTGKTEEKKFKTCTEGIKWCRRVTKHNWSVSKGPMPRRYP